MSTTRIVDGKLVIELCKKGKILIGLGLGISIVALFNSMVVLYLVVVK